MSTLGVGFIGAGPVTQAIHLPTLARVGDLFEVRHVCDVDEAVAATVAGRVGARHSGSIDQLLDDPTVDVVAVCSPHRFHAEQVIAACRASKLAVLCEKPFAMSPDEARGIVAASNASRVPIIVGAMHTYDRGWRQAFSAWREAAATARTIRSSIVLPPNPRFEDFATEVITRPEPRASGHNDRAAQAALVEAGVMGLAIHDLPLVRALLATAGAVTVLDARYLGPFGYQISLTVGEVLVELHALMSATWQPSWLLQAFAADAALEVEFTPSYVQAGSASGRVSHGTTATMAGPFDDNGYEAEWRELAGIVRGELPAPETGPLIDDLTFALQIADASGAHVRQSSGDSARRVAVPA